MSAVAHIDEYKTGRFYQEDYRGDLSWNGYENNVLLHNEGLDANGMPQYVDLGQALGADDISDARGIAVADFDNDGDLDLVINNNPGDRGLDGAPPVLLRNDLGQQKHWVAVELTGTSSNREAVGAEVHIEVGEQTQMRLVSAGSSYAGQHSMRLYFGLGQAESIDQITVKWPSGHVDRYEQPPIHQLIEITEQGEMTARPLPQLADGNKLATAKPPLAQPPHQAKAQD